MNFVDETYSVLLKDLEASRTDYRQLQAELARLTADRDGRREDFRLYAINAVQLARAADARITELQEALKEILVMYRRAQEIGGDADQVLNNIDEVARTALNAPWKAS